MVPAGSDRVSRARPYSGTCRGRLRNFAYGAVTRCGPTFHSVPLSRNFVTSRPAGRRIMTGPTTPGRQRLPSITSPGFGLFPFRSPLLRESRFLSFRLGTKMFQFPSLSPRALCVQARVRTHYRTWVPPFGNLRIKSYVLIPVAYRSLSRPSSPIGTKASIMCS